MTWTLIFALAAAAYAFKALGLVVIGARELPAPMERSLALLPAAMIAGIAAHDTVVSGSGFGLDARVAGVAIALIAAWLRAPFVVVVLAAAATTALLRAVQ
jgi:branched-subunit amino acid transport protein